MPKDHKTKAGQLTMMIVNNYSESRVQKHLLVTIGGEQIVPSV
jgi:hypothetical protein